MINIKQEMIKFSRILLVVLLVAILSSCSLSKDIVISADFPEYFETSESLEIDFTTYINVKDVNNAGAKITNEMLDLTDINYQKPGYYTLRVNYRSLNDELYVQNFIVIFKGQDYTLHETTTLDAPSNILVFLQDDLSIIVKFDRVSGATTYLMQIYTPENELVKKEEISPNAQISLNNPGNYYLTITSIGDGNYTVNSLPSERIYFNISVKNPNDSTIQNSDSTTHLQNNLNKLNEEVLHGSLPSLGSPKILIIPVEFSDYKLSSLGIDSSTIEKGFFGNAADTGWESLTSYYQKSSYGKLSLSGKILPTYQAKYNSRYYNNLFANDSGGDDTILDEVLNYYDSTVDFSEYDTNNDGYIDGIYLVYAHPQDYENDNLWWAWQNWATCYDSISTYDGVKANYFMWASAGFMLEGIDCGDGYDRFDYEATYSSSLKINMHTFIHETGHMLGLDDYYDYDTQASSGPTGGLGGADIMDYTVGDHCPFSKMMLGWVNPIIVLDTVTIEIHSFEKTGECIMIPKNFVYNNYFDEYLTIDFYTPTGLNALDADYLFRTPGVRIMQVDATFNNNFDISIDRSAFMFNNSDTKHKQIRYIEANGSFDIEKTTSRNQVFADENDLFKAGDIFAISNTKWINLTWYDGSQMNFTIKIDSITAEVATITITLK